MPEPDEISTSCLLLRVIGTSHQRTRFHMAEPHGKPFFLQQCKFGGIVKPGDGQMVSRRLKILANRDDVTIDGPKVALQHNIGLGGAAVVSVYKPAEVAA